MSCYLCEEYNSCTPDLLSYGSQHALCINQNQGLTKLTYTLGETSSKTDSLRHLLVLRTANVVNIQKGRMKLLRGNTFCAWQLAQSSL